MRIGQGYDVHKLVEGRDCITVSYTHLDVYKRQFKRFEECNYV